LKSAIEAYLAAWNNEPKPFVWTATVESITEKLSRCRQTLEIIRIPSGNCMVDGVGQPRVGYFARFGA
jgi:hypothetical protein